MDVWDVLRETQWIWILLCWLNFGLGYWRGKSNGGK